MVELVVVVGLILLAAAIGWPVLARAVGSSKKAMGVNAVTAAVRAMRVYAARPLQPDLGPQLLGDSPDGEPYARYHGTMLLFTPSGEIRLTYNDQVAVNEQLNFLQGGLVGEVRIGYADIPQRDPINLPAGVGAFGIARARQYALTSRTNSPNEANARLDPHGMPLMLAPPFGVRFDRQGRIVSSAEITERSLDPADDADPIERRALVCYDGNYDGVFLTGLKPGHPHGADRGEAISVGVGATSGANSTALGMYNPQMWDPEHPLHARAMENPYLASAIYNQRVQRFTVPFEEIETVVGVLIYNKRAFWDWLDHHYVYRQSYPFAPSDPPNDDADHLRYYLARDGSGHRWYPKIVRPRVLGDSKPEDLGDDDYQPGRPGWWLLRHGRIVLFAPGTGAPITVPATDNP